MNASQCAEMIAHVARSSCAATATAAPPSNPAPIPPDVAVAPAANLDALAVAVTSQGSSVAAQANAVSVLALVIGIVALIGAVTWGYFVRRWALDLARQTVETWMNENAPGEIAKYQAQIAGGSDGQSPEDQARGLGEESA